MGGVGCVCLVASSRRRLPEVLTRSECRACVSIVYLVTIKARDSGTLGADPVCMSLVGDMGGADVIVRYRISGSTGID